MFRVLSDAKGLQEIPSFEGCIALEILRVDRSGLVRIPEGICKNSPRIKSL